MKPAGNHRQICLTVLKELLTPIILVMILKSQLIFYLHNYQFGDLYNTECYY